MANTHLNPTFTANLKADTAAMEAVAKKNAEFASPLPPVDPKAMWGLQLERITLINPGMVAGLGVQGSINRGPPFGSAIPRSTVITELLTTPAGVVVTNKQKGIRSLVPWANIAIADLLENAP